MGEDVKKNCTFFVFFYCFFLSVGGQLFVVRHRGNKKNFFFAKKGWRKIRKDDFLGVVGCSNAHFSPERRRRSLQNAFGNNGFLSVTFLLKKFKKPSDSFSFLSFFKKSQTFFFLSVSTETVMQCSGISMHTYSTVHSTVKVCLLRHLLEAQRPRHANLT